MLIRMIGICSVDGAARMTHEGVGPGPELEALAEVSSSAKVSVTVRNMKHSLRFLRQASRVAGMALLELQ